MVTNNANNTYLVATSTHEVTRPVQPAFLVIPSGNQSNVTGDGTVYSIVFDVETFDQNSDWDGTSTFTAPITGKYYFSVFVLYQSIGAGHTDGHVRITTSNRTYECSRSNIYVKSTSGYYVIGAERFTELEIGDTCMFVAAVYNSTKTITIALASNRDSANGYLVC